MSRRPTACSPSRPTSGGSGWSWHGARSSWSTNDGVLPSRTGRRRRVAVIGPIADSARDLLGRLQPRRPHGDAARDATGGRTRSASTATAQSIAVRDELAGRTTILDAIRARFGRERGRARARDRDPRRHRRGHRDGGRRRARRRRRRSSSSANGPGLTDDATTGEFRDRREPRPPSAASRSCSRRSSRPARRSSSSSSAAGRWRSSGPPTTAPRSCWPGSPATSGPAAIAEVLAGDLEPRRQAAGHGPARRRPGPAHLSPPPDRRPVELEGRLRRRPVVAALAVRLRPVVHALRADRPPARRQDRGRHRPAATCHDPRRRHATPATRAGDEVVQLYVRDEEASVARPVRELRGFRRRPPGSRASARTVAFRARREQFAFTDIDRRRVVEPGPDRPVRRAVRRRTCRSTARSSSSDRPSSWSIATTT